MFFRKNKVKKIFLFFIGLILLLSLTIPASAWDDCPFGYENESYPGSCWRYIDTNGDGICDKSQSEPVYIQENENSQGSSGSINNQKINENKNLTVLIISFIVILFSIILIKYLKNRGAISNSREKILWNILLFIFFLPSGITGIFLVLMPSFSFLREISMNFIDLHSYTSFFFMWISAYHIIWHTRYYIKGIKSLFADKNTRRPKEKK